MIKINNETLVSPVDPTMDQRQRILLFPPDWKIGQHFSYAPCFTTSDNPTKQEIQKLHDQGLIVIFYQIWSKTS